MRFMKSSAVGMAFATAFTFGLAASTSAQDKIPYPHRVVTLVTHSSAGGGSDVLLRDMTKYLKRVIEADFVVENVTGGSSAKAMAFMAGQKPDGSVLYAATPSYVYTSLISDLSAEYDDLEPLVNMFLDTQVIYTRYDAPFQSLNNFVEYSKTNRSAWGGGGASSLERITMEKMKKLTGVNATIVTSDGGGENMINVLNGTLDVGLGDNLEIKSQVDGKQLRLLAVLADEQLTQLPGVPTAKESGVDLVVRKFRGLAGPKGLSPEIVKIWEEAIPRVLADPEFKQTYEANSLVATFMPHDEFVKFSDEFYKEQEQALVDVGILKR